MGTTNIKRLKFLSIKEKSGDGTLEKPATQFFYDETIAFPRRLSYDQDHLDYSNNQTLSTPVNSKLMPTTWACTTRGGSNSNSDTLATKAFVLNKIVQPTGVSSFYQYEAHVMGASLKIKKCWGS